MSCTHQVLVKVIDELGLMRGETADVLRAHYECQDCGLVMLRTENKEAIERVAMYYGLVDRFEVAGDAIANAVNVLRRNQQDTRKALPPGKEKP